MWGIVNAYVYQNSIDSLLLLIVEAFTRFDEKLCFIIMALYMADQRLNLFCSCLECLLYLKVEK